MKEPTFRRTKPEHEVAFQDVLDLLRRHSDKVDALEMLLIAANLVGRLAAHQNHKRWTPEQIMKMVADNIQVGNTQAVAEMQKQKPKGSA